MFTSQQTIIFSMDEGLVFDGKKYISSRKAADISGYTMDYIGQLCRKGVIESKMVGKTRFVSQASLLKYASLGEENDASHSTTVISDSRESKSEQYISPIKVLPDESPLFPKINKFSRPVDKRVSPFEEDLIVQITKSRKERKPLLSLLSLVIVFYALASALPFIADSSSLGKMKEVGRGYALGLQQTLDLYTASISSVGEKNAELVQLVNDGNLSQIASVADGSQSFLTRLREFLAFLFGKDAKPKVATSTKKTTPPKPTPIKEETKATSTPDTRTIYVEGPKTIVERITERVPVGSGISASYLEERLQSLNSKLLTEIYKVSQTAKGPVTNIYQDRTTINDIDHLDGATITGPLYDTTESAGTDGYVLQTTGEGVEWVATSTLGISGGGVSVWGDLTGTLSDQTDLQAELDDRLTLSTWYATTTDALTEGSTNLFSQWAETGSDIYYNTGKVGIGDSTPDAPLHVYTTENPGTQRTLLRLETADSQTDTGYNIDFAQGGVVAQRIAGVYENAGVVGLAFSTYGGGLSEKLRITGTGNIGIGTTSPYAKLSVAGETVAEKFTATSTSATSTLPRLSISTGVSLLGEYFENFTSYLRGRLSSSATGLSYNSSTGDFSLTSGYDIPLTASTTNWNIFYNTPSSRITDGTGLTWSGSTLNCDTASGSIQGCLTSADWTTFNSKVSSQWTTNGSSIYYNSGSVGIGTTTPESIFAVSAANPSVTLRDSDSSNTTYKLRNGGAGSGIFDIYNQTNNISMLSMTSEMFMVGTTTNVFGNPSRMFVYGGPNGANIDVMGEPVLGRDQAVIELQSSDWDSTFESSYLVHYGPLASGSTMGFSNNRLGALVFQGVSGIIQALGDSSDHLIFGTNSSERMRITGGGNVGIGTTTPYAKLSVVGEIVGEKFTATSTTATSTFSGGLQVGNNSGLHVSSSGAVSIGHSLSEVSALSSSGNFTLFNQSGNPAMQTDTNGIRIGDISPASFGQYFAINFESDANFQFMNGNVGIGTTTPYAKLSVVGETVSTFFTATSTTATSTLSGGLSVAGSSGLNVLQGGRVGIGTASPAATDASSLPVKLEISGGGLGLANNTALSFRTSSNSLGPAVKLDSSNVLSFGDLQNVYGNTIQFHNGGGAKAYLTTAGRFGLSAPVPQALLDVRGTAIFNDDGGDFDFRIEGDTDSSLLFVDASTDRVGLGTLSPAAKLDIDTGSNTSGLRLRGLAETTEIADIYVEANGALVLNTIAGSDTNPYIDLRTDDSSYGLILREGTGTNLSSYANFYMNDAAIDYLNINVQGTNASAGLVLQSGGNVGIGTTTPLSKLQVHGATAAASHFMISSGTGITDALGASQTGMSVNNGTEKVLMGVQSSLGFVGTYSATGFGIITSNATRLLADSSGNIGIGTTTPGTYGGVASRLDITSTGHANVAINSGTSLTNPIITLGRASTPDWYIRSVGSDSTRRFSILAGDAATETFNIIQTGKVGIGTTSPGSNLEVHSTGATEVTINGTASNATLKLKNSSTLKWQMLNNVSLTDRLQITNGTNGVMLNQGDTLWSSVSDARLKKNVETLSVLEKLDNYRAVRFNWKEGSSDTQIGVIAQELYEIFPEAVNKGSDDPNAEVTAMGAGTWSVKYESLAPIALEGVKELNLKLESIALPKEEGVEMSFSERFFAKISQWLADAANGLGSVFANAFEAKERICVDGECLTSDDIRALRGLTNSSNNTSGMTAATAGGLGDTNISSTTETQNSTGTTTETSTIENATGTENPDSLEPVQDEITTVTDIPQADVAPESGPVEPESATGSSQTEETPITETVSEPAVE